MVTEATAVYHLFDASHAYLYIGMTNDPKRRFGQHAAKDWWQLVDPAHTRIIWHPTRNAAALDEAYQIATHRPPRNELIVGPRPAVSALVPWDAEIALTDWDAVIEQLLAVDDPADRACLTGAALAELAAEQSQLSRQRHACVVELRETMSFAEIGRQLDLHRNRVQQIYEGRPGGGQGGSAKTETEA